MKLVYGTPNYYFLCTYDERMTAKNAGFWWSPEGEEPLPSRGIWWTAGHSTADKLSAYATEKASARLRKVGKQRAKIRRLTADAARAYVEEPVPKPEKVKRTRKSRMGKEFDDLCRGMGIPVRASFKSEAAYQRARTKDLTAAIKGV